MVRGEVQRSATTARRKRAMFVIGAGLSMAAAIALFLGLGGGTPGARRKPRASP